MPEVRQQAAFLTSLIALTCSHYFWLTHFLSHYHSTTHVLSFMLFAVWLVPFGFFVSLSINAQNFLPALEGTGGCYDNPDACAAFKYYTEAVYSLWPVSGPAAGRKWRRPSLTTSPREPPRLLRRLRAGLSNPKPRPSSSDAKEASRKASREGSQNEAWPF